ncbi:MAG: protein translocase subunit SecDF [Bacteroidaceae bacterium]|nr:protein translocase subunit SecDF [Prevotellaceae bacterium]MDY5632668.1 protein translocase subunit SecDF [Bacteroidaceae bacterium]
MQNKGFVTLIAGLLTAICLFYMSFGAVVNHYEGKAEAISATQGEEAGQRYLDSLNNQKVYLGVWSLKDCRELGLGLGLDLKGGMNVILEVSVSDVVKALSDHKEATNERFAKAIEAAQKASAEGKGDFITLFVKEYDGNLAELFATQQLRDKVNAKSTNAEVVRVLRQEVKAAISNSYNVLRTRIDRFGVVQPNIQELEGQEGRIMVEMPGVKEPERVRNLLQGSANLEFWETYEASEIAQSLVDLDAALAAAQGGNKVDTTAAVAQTDDIVEDTAKAAKLDVSKAVAAATGAQAKPAAQDAASREQAEKEHPVLSRLSIQPSGCIVGVAQKRDLEKLSEMFNSAAAKQALPSDLRLKWAVKGINDSEAADIYYLYAIRVTERDGRAPLEGDVITEATDAFDQFGRPSVSMKMNVEGARRWAALTKMNVNRSIAIVLDDNVYSAPNVMNEITGGSSEITGNFTAEDTKDLANVLKSGKMPAPAHIVSEEIVGPTLGAESIQMGIYSAIIAFVILMVYMMMMYGVIPGLVADGALLLNLFFTIGILTSFQAALTMSGIAGLVLSLGMAVDANVLIYERAKEELATGKGVREALAAGYSNAFSAILDSNVTSLLTAFILYYFGTGPIRGFATTLGIGICVSFFTAVFLTRVVYTTMHAKDKWLKLTFTTAVGNSLSFKNTQFNFMGSYKKSFLVFGLLAVVSLGVIFTRGFSKSIDFTGGRNYVVVFDQETQPEQVRAVLGKAFPESNTSAIAIGTDNKTIRISTNYRINEEGVQVDSEIEKNLYNALMEANLLAGDLELSSFINRDVREGGSIISSQKVGPSVAEDITNGAMIAVGLAFVAIFVYILVRFRNLAFSVGAIVALMSDLLVILGAYAILWGLVPFSLEIDQTFIGAILTAVGYSINDKVVVFDRIRENFGLHPKRDHQSLFNMSLNSTLNRTINTSVSTFIVLAVIFVIGLFFKGADSIISFSFAMILGVVFGTFSSIFVAAPVAYLVMGEKIKEETNQA